MAVTIDSLEIEIAASSEDAIAHVRELVSALEELRSITNSKFGDVAAVIKQVTKATGGTRRKASVQPEAAKNLSDAASASNELADSEKNAAETAEEAAEKQKDYYDQLSKIIEKNSKASLTLARLKRQIEETTEAWNQMTKDGLAGSSKWFSVAEKVKGLTEQYDELNKTMSGGALKELSLSLREVEGAEVEAITRTWLLNEALGSLRGILTARIISDMQKPLRDMFSETNEQVEDLSKTAIDARDTASSSIKDILKGLNFQSILQAKSVWKDFGEQAKSVWKDFGASVKSRAGILRSDIEAVAYDVGQAFVKEYISEISTVIVWLEVIKAKIHDSLRSLASNNEAKYVGASIAQPIVLAWLGIQYAISGTASVLKQAIAMEIPEAIKKANKAILDFGKRIGSWLVKQFRAVTLSAVKFAVSIPTRPFVSLGNTVKSATKSIQGFLRAIGRIMIYRAIRRAIQVITGSLREGIQNLYQYSRIVDTQFHNSMDQLATDALYLKNSFASIAGPLIDSLAPAIDAITDKLATAMSYAAEMVAALTGRSSYSRAVKQATEYMEAVEGIGDAAKEAKKYLIGIDELTIFDPNQNTKDIPDYSGMFEEVPVSNNMLEAVENIKKSLDGIPEVIHTAWEMTGLDMVDSFKTALSTVLDLARDIQITSRNVFVDGFGLDLLNSVYNTLDSIADIINVIALTFRAAWDDNGRGYDYIASIFTMFTDIFNLLESIGRAFANAWATTIGVDIASNLLEIFTGIHTTIGNISESILSAWENSNIGTLIWLDVLQIIDDVLSAINRMIQATSEWAAGLDFSPLFTAFENALSTIEPLVRLIADDFAWAWENVLLPFGGWTIEEALPAVIDLLGAAFNVLHEVLEALQPVAAWVWENWLQPLASWTGEIFIAAMREITDLLNDFADLIGGRISFSEFISNLTATQSILFSILAVVTAIEGIVAASTIAKMLSGGFFAKLAEALAYVAGGAGTLHEALMLVFGPASILAGIAGVVGGATLAITNFLSMLENGFSWVKEALMLVGIAIAAVGAIVLGAPALVAGVVAAVVAAVATAVVVIKEHWEDIVDFFKNLPERIGYFLGYIVGKFSDFADDCLKWLIELSLDIAKAFEDAISYAIQFVTDFMGELYELPGKMLDLGIDIIKGLWKGISDGVLDFFENVGDFVKGFIDGVKDGLGINSPSKVFAGIGGSVVEGLWDGLSDNWHSVTDFFSNAWRRLTNDTSSDTEKLKSDTVAQFTALKNGVNNTLGDINLESANEWAKIRSSTISNTTGLKTQVSNTFNSLKETISSVWSGIKSTTQTTLSSISGMVGSMTNTISGAVSGIKGKLSDIVSSAANSANSVNSKMGQIMDDISRSTREASQNLQSIQVKQYATGGFPAQGQIFIANEYGPELVGRIGNQTAVANNDQIVKGIADGVSDANVDVINAIAAAAIQIASAIQENGGGETVNWDRASLNVTRGQNRYARMSGKAVTYN